MFGTPLDDDIIQTAGRLAGETRDELIEKGAAIEAIWVFEIPMSLPLDAPLPDAQVKRARAALPRAKLVGEEYEGVDVATATVRARRAGQAIVTRPGDVESRRSCSPPRRRPGAWWRLLGGVADRSRTTLARSPVRDHEGAVPRDPDRPTRGLAHERAPPGAAAPAARAAAGDPWSAKTASTLTPGNAADYEPHQPGTAVD